MCCDSFTADIFSTLLIIKISCWNTYPKIVQTLEIKKRSDWNSPHPNSQKTILTRHRLVCSMWRVVTSRKVWSGMSAQCQSLVSIVITCTSFIHLNVTHISSRLFVRLNSKANSSISARCTLLKDKALIFKQNKLKGNNIYIEVHFSQKLTDMRKCLSVHLKAGKSDRKRDTLVYDHILMEGKKFRWEFKRTKLGFYRPKVVGSLPGVVPETRDVDECQIIIVNQ